MLSAMKLERQISLQGELRLLRERHNNVKCGNSALRIKELREIKGLSQRELSEKSNIARSYLSELERGVYNNPTIDIICKLASAFGCTLDEIVKYKG